MIFRIALLAERRRSTMRGMSSRVDRPLVRTVSGTAPALRGGASLLSTAPALRGGASLLGTAPALRGGASLLGTAPALRGGASLLLAVVVGLLCATGCRSAPYVWVQQLPPEPLPSGRTIIGVGDVIEIQVYGDEKMTTRGRVLADGTLTLPLIGPVSVVGKRPEELAASLDTQLTRWITAPKVTVIIVDSQVSVAVIGEVKTPGVVELLTPATVLEALAKTGGMTEFADSSSIFVLRSRGGTTRRIRFKYSALVEADPAATRFHLKTGDVLVVE